MKNLVPQLFYDLLARIVPGATLILAAAVVIYSPITVLEFILTSPSVPQLFGVVPTVIWILASYLIGFVLGELWELTLGQLNKKAEEHIEHNCKEYRLNEHGKLTEIVDQQSPRLAPDDLPQASVMRNHIQQVAPSESARLLKLRAERRLCQALVLGFSALLVVNAYYVSHNPTFSRLAMEFFLALAVVSCATRNLRLYRQYVDGICVTWLIRVLPLIRSKRGLINRQSDSPVLLHHRGSE